MNQQESQNQISAFPGLKPALDFGEGCFLAESGRLSLHLGETFLCAISELVDFFAYFFWQKVDFFHAFWEEEDSFAHFFFCQKWIFLAVYTPGQN